MTATILLIVALAAVSPAATIAVWTVVRAAEFLWREARDIFVFIAALVVFVAALAGYRYLTEGAP